MQLQAPPPPLTEGLSHYRTFETTLHIWSGIVDADIAAIIAPCIQHKQQFWMWIADILKIPVFIRVLFQQKICAVLCLSTCFGIVLLKGEFNLAGSL